MLRNQSGRLCAAICFLFIGSFLSCTSDRSSPVVYRFVKVGNWFDAKNWDGPAPGDSVRAGDSVIIMQNGCATIDDARRVVVQGVLFLQGGSVIAEGPLTIRGKMIVSTIGFVNLSSLTNQGQITFTKSSYMGQWGSGTTSNQVGGTITSAGDLEFLTGGFFNAGTFDNQAGGLLLLKGQSSTAGTLRNEGTIQIGGGVHFKGGNLNNLGAIVGDEAGYLAMDSGTRLYNGHSAGTIQLKYHFILAIQSGGVFQNDGTVMTEKNSNFMNWGGTMNNWLIRCNGKLTNLGQFQQSNGLQEGSTAMIRTVSNKTGASTPGLFFGDTVFNGKNFDNGGVPMVNTGAGVVVNYFNATIKGYTPNISYAITSQPQNANCPNPGCQVYFRVGTSGLPINYVWQLSKDGGRTWASVPAGQPYHMQGGELEITNPPDTFSGYRYRCALAGVGPNDTATSGAATLTLVGGRGK